MNADAVIQNADVQHYARELLDLTLDDAETPKLVYELVAVLGEAVLKATQAAHEAGGEDAPDWGAVQVARHKRAVLLEAARELERAIEEAME